MPFIQFSGKKVDLSLIPELKVVKVSIGEIRISSCMQIAKDSILELNGMYIQEIFDHLGPISCKVKKTWKKEDCEDFYTTFLFDLNDKQYFANRRWVIQHRKGNQGNDT
jgi:hypothetical protein